MIEHVFSGVIGDRLLRFPLRRRDFFGGILQQIMRFTARLPQETVQDARRGIFPHLVEELSQNKLHQLTELGVEARIAGGVLVLEQAMVEPEEGHLEEHPGQLEVHGDAVHHFQHGVVHHEGVFWVFFQQEEVGFEVRWSGEPVVKKTHLKEEQTTIKSPCNK